MSDYGVYGARVTHLGRRPPGPDPLWEYQWYTCGMETKQIKVPADVHARVKRLAADRGETIAEVIAAAVAHEKTRRERVADQQHVIELMRRDFGWEPDPEDETWADQIWERIETAQPEATE